MTAPTTSAPVLPDLPEPIKARITCEDCDGRGEVGEPRSMGEFQPPERAECSSCQGSGIWHVDAFDATSMRDYALAAIAASSPAAPAQPVSREDFDRVVQDLERGKQLVTDIAAMLDSKLEPQLILDWIGERTGRFLVVFPAPVAQPAPVSTGAVEQLTRDEMQELIKLLSLDHDGSDFEAECPACTAYQKLSAAASRAKPAAADAGAVELLTQAEKDVLAERASQRIKWGDAHDDEHTGDLREAAICYAQGYMTWRHGKSEQRWPWEIAAWKLRDPRSNAVRAAAMLIADIDRRDRADIAATKPASKSPSPIAGGGK